MKETATKRDRGVDVCDQGRGGVQPGLSQGLTGDFPVCLSGLLEPR